MGGDHSGEGSKMKYHGGDDKHRPPVHMRQLSQQIVNLEDHLPSAKTRTHSLSLTSLAESHGQDEEQFLSGHVDSVAVMNRQSPGSTPNRTPSSSVDL